MKDYDLQVFSLKSEKDILNYNKYKNQINPGNPYFNIELHSKSTNSNDLLKYFILSKGNKPQILMLIYLKPILPLVNRISYFDVISPYGYSGPLRVKNLQEETLVLFWEEIDKWYRKNKIVTEFIRFGLNGNHVNYNGHLVKTLNNVKGFICDEEEQWLNYKTKVRNNYRKALKHNLIFKLFFRNIKEENIIDFYNIYTQTMSRNIAEKEYFYSFDYFKTLIINNLDHCALAIVYKDNISISAELLLLETDTINSHLGGTNSEYFSLRPNDFLKINVINWGRANEFKFYNLGGGKTNDDSLYMYKKSFFPHDNDVIFYTGRKIINAKVYNELLSKNNIKNNGENIIEGDFFPLYRLMNSSPKINHLKIIKTKQEWDLILNKIGNFDFYHTFHYHEISKKNKEEPILIVYEKDNLCIALPLLIRPISGSEYYDATSVYGYAGPISINLSKNINLYLFTENLKLFFKQNNIISVFSRLNPFIENQVAILNSIGITEELGNVVNIDLTKDINDQRTLYSKTTKRYLNKVRKLCYTKVSANKEDILKFIDLYYENMDRVNAADRYYFDENYFLNFIDNHEYKTDIIFALLKDTHEIISAAMMIKTNNNIIQYHISGTLNDYVHLTPIRLLIDEMRIIGTREGYKYFNLGGGLGSQEDTLFQFKASFSKEFKKFKIWKYIVNEKVYEQLCDDNKYLNKNDNITYFPQYRYKNKI